MNDWRNNTLYAVVRDFPTLPGRPRAALEMDLAEMSVDDVIETLADEPDEMVAVFAFNPVEGWARDVSEDMAREWARRMERAGDCPVNDFTERYLGLSWAEARRSEAA